MLEQLFILVNQTYAPSALEPNPREGTKLKSYLFITVVICIIENHVIMKNDNKI